MAMGLITKGYLATKKINKQFIMCDNLNLSISKPEITLSKKEFKLTIKRKC